MPDHRQKHGFGCVNLGADYTDEEREFMIALDRYKRANHRPFPTCRDILIVMKALGYQKAAEANSDNDAEQGGRVGKN